MKRSADMLLTWLCICYVSEFIITVSINASRVKCLCKSGFTDTLHLKTFVTNLANAIGPITSSAGVYQNIDTLVLHRYFVIRTKKSQVVLRCVE